jgi:SAM-dependent methyltransferase
MYLLLPAADEPAMVRRAVEPGGTLLELGCGVGRLTRALLEVGYRVTAVDESGDMLAHVEPSPGLEIMQARIERLDLRRTFDGVLMASHLINTDDVAQRRAFLEACRRHLADERRVVIQRMDPASAAWEPGHHRSTRLGSVTITARTIARAGKLVDAVAGYVADDGRTWNQPYRAEILDDEDFERALGASGLRLDRWLNRERTWASAGINHHPSGGGRRGGPRRR